MTSRRALVSLALAGAALAAAPRPASAHPSPAPPEGAAAVLAWNATASTVLSVDAAMPAPVMAVGMAYVQAAVYNAVAGIRGAHLYRSTVRAPSGASTAAAVAAAARRVLNAYVPVGTARVEAAYAAALAALPQDAATLAGVAHGERTAAHLIAQRSGDGWLAPVTFSRPLAPGVWRPTPPRQRGLPRAMARRDAAVRAAVARPVPAGSAPGAGVEEVRPRPRGGGCGGVGRQHPAHRAADRGRPLLRGEPQRAAAGGLPRPRGAPRLRRDAGGSLPGGGHARRCRRGHHVLGRQAPLRRLAPSHRDPARDTDGNAATVADPDSTSLLATPPFPDYLGGRAAVIGSVTRALRSLERSGRST